MSKIPAVLTALLMSLALAVGLAPGAASGASGARPEAASPLTGTYRGQVQGDGPRYRLTVEFRRGANRPTADVYYSRLRCTGEWRLIRRVGSEYRLRERITRDPNGACESGGLIRLYDLQGPRLLYTYGPNTTRAQLAR